MKRDKCATMHLISFVLLVLLNDSVQITNLLSPNIYPATHWYIPTFTADTSLKLVVIKHIFKY